MLTCSFPRSNRRTLRRCSVLVGMTLLALALPGLALADNNITFANFDQQNSYTLEHTDRHVCIDDPGYFNKTIPAGGNIRVTAKWMSPCTPDTLPHIEVCLQESHVDGRCITIEQGGSKIFEILDGELNEADD